MEKNNFYDDGRDPDELSMHEEKFLACIKKDPSNLSAASRIAFPHTKDPYQKAHHTMAKPKIYLAWAKYTKLWSKTIPDSELISKHKELLNAEKIVVLGEGRMEIVPDNSARLNALKLAYELKRLVRAEDPESLQKFSSQVIVIFKGELRPPESE